MDDSSSRNSLKLDIDQKVLSGSETGEPKEVYKPIPEDSYIGDSNKVDQNKDEKMVQNGDNIRDGADEKMLDGGGDEKAQLTNKKEEVKFISGDQQNGDAKIDIGALEKAFTGMTKDELMKYANDPFWIRLRWIFFILFWGLWLAMLICAILIIVHAPKCAAPTPLPWYKQGPLIKFLNINFADEHIEAAQKIKAKGVIYELAGEETYSVHKADTEDKIKKLIEHYKEKDMNVILDLTPNYVTEDAELFKGALENDSLRSAFVWVDQPVRPTNWHSKYNTSAWAEVDVPNALHNKQFVLSQFGAKKYDLRMDDERVKEELNKVLRHLVSLGVKGFRLSNAKHFIISKELKDDSLADDGHTDMNDYKFYTHSHTTFQEGLGNLLHEYASTVNNATDGDGFLSINEDIVYPEIFKNKYGLIGFDLPIYRRFPRFLLLNNNTTKNDLLMELNNTFTAVGNSSWLQWNCPNDSVVTLNPSAYNIFLALLPGVPVYKANSELLNGANESIFSKIEHLRQSPSYMHGTFNIVKSGDMIAFSRIKSGNPGYFVVLNPTSSYGFGNFTSETLPKQMTVHLLSDNYNATDVAEDIKMPSDAIPMSPYSAAILTYVPIK